MSLRVGIDVGGTFTDIVLYDEFTRRLWINKTPSTPDNLLQGIFEGLKGSGISFKDIKYLVISTTVATNALITGNVPRTALITTKGFRDVLEIRRGTREDIWDHYKDPAPPLVRRRDRHEVTERINYRGEIVQPLDRDEARRVVQLIKEKGIKSIAICLINSYINPVHELELERIVREHHPESFVATSTEINPEIFEYERTSTTVLTACLMPIANSFFGEIEDAFRREGFKGGILVVHSGGGVMTPKTAVKQAVRLVGSGPSAGAMATTALSSVIGIKNAIGLDVGGTSADVSLIYQGTPRTKKEWWIVYGATIRIPAIDVTSIGAGGGSVAWIDEAGVLHVGPQSMGADPGPACYGKGGEEPTLTDANVVAGRLSKEAFLGGKVTIRPDLSERVVGEKIARRLSLSLAEAAEGIIRVAGINMSNAVRLVSIARGYDPREFALIAFGGLGPLYASIVARELAIPKVIIPRWPGATSAYGTLLVDVRHDMMKTYITTLTQDAVANELEENYNELEEKMTDLLREEGFTDDKIIITREADMRYLGQWRSLTLPIARPLPRHLDSLLETFHNTHQREYGYMDRSQMVEVYSLRVIGMGMVSKIVLPEKEGDGSEKEALKGRRKVYIDGGYIDLAVYEREKLPPGSFIEGPAIIEQFDSTTLVKQGDVLEVDRYGNLLITIRGW